MFCEVNHMKVHISDLLAQALKKIVPNPDEVNSSQIYWQLSSPPTFDMGQLCYPCFALSKLLKKAPPQIGADIVANILKTDLISDISVQGPYVNFKYNFAALAKSLIPQILNGLSFKHQLTIDEPKTIIEFSQPNTHKELHVGHMRNLCLGDAIVKLHRYCGVETLATTFPGDVGTHVAKCLWYYEKYNQEPIPQERKGAWLGSLYTKANNLLEEQKGTELEDDNRSELTTILKQLHAGEGHYYELWKQTRQWSIELMQSVYKWAGVEFDSWYWESDVDADSVALVKKWHDKGLFVEDQGAIGMDLKADKLGFCLLLKSDGTGLYATKDLELARRKFEDHGIKKSIYVVDNRQALHFKQVFKTLEKMGFEQSKDCYHLQYEMVELTDGAMSSRKGNIVPLQSLIDQMVAKIKSDYLDRYEGWKVEKKDEVANMVAAGAIKFGMTRVDNNKKIVFDMAQWLKLDGESGPYIQYVHARIQSMLKKLGFDKSTQLNYAVLTHSLEQQILYKLSHFNDTVQEACKQYKTLLVCSYLYDLSKLFNSFYAECPVANAESVELKNARAALCYSVASTLNVGLGLLGIQAPDQM